MMISFSYSIIFAKTYKSFYSNILKMNTFSLTLLLTYLSLFSLLVSVSQARIIFKISKGKNTCFKDEF
jgi:hypothetical protein